MPRPHLISTLLLVALMGCGDGWYENERRYYGSFEGQRAPEPLGFGDDDDATADDDDATSDDDDATPPANDDDTAADDDDTAADDDDTVSDDDDTVSDDDDTTADDDDATADDDDTALPSDDDDATDAPADDDDATAPTGPWPPDPPAGDPNPSNTADYDIVMSVPEFGTDFGLISMFNFDSREIVVENVGFLTIDVDLSLSATGAFELLGPGEVPLTLGSAEDWMLTFNPTSEGYYSATVTATYMPVLGGPPGPWTETMTFYGEAYNPDDGEAVCDDGWDDDGDGDTDCDDEDCSLFPACGGIDPCCPEGDGVSAGGCGDTGAMQDVCALSPVCCSLAWTDTCADLYAVDANAFTCE